MIRNLSKRFKKAPAVKASNTTPCFSRVPHFKGKFGSDIKAEMF